MFKKQHLALAIAATLAAGSAQAALETSVTLKNETARFVKDGIRTGEATSTTDTTGEGKGVYKFENTAKIYLNDELESGGSWHGELNIVRDSKAIDGYDGHESYTQKDWLRELYVDTKAGDWDLRLGKQQVVWGTADGIKLLDMINPTDWSEFNQNTMADARIPVWMVNAERYLDNGGNIQIIASQAKTNRMAGLTVADGSTRSVAYNNPLGGAPSDNSQLVSQDAGAPFVFKGVDTITGGVNGFLNIGAAMGTVTTTFWGEGAGVDLNGDGNIGSFTNPFNNNLNQAEDFTVGAFTQIAAGGAAALGCGAASGAQCLETFTEMTNQNVTNLVDVDGNGNGWDVTNPNSVWEYMTNATFATFNTYVGMTTRYEANQRDDFKGNLATRFRNTTDSGLNYSLNYAYAINPNPVVNIHWESSTGERLVAREFVKAVSGATVVQIQNQAGTQAYGGTADFSAAGNWVGGNAPLDHAPVAGVDPVTLVFEETLERNHNIGTSFDTALGGDSPLILRGEFLYQKDVSTPIVDRNALARGNLTAALTTQKSDFFKYVIGLDKTIMTDMMLSGQFIQFRNLDYVDNNTNGAGAACATANCGVYTADPATMHLTNGLQKAEENKNFYSVFLSKPFGDSGEGRWNNIFIYEEGGGKWNRFDVEYGINDQLIGTIEYNKYFGDENTMFGQFENASNVQIGVKYLLQ